MGIHLNFHYHRKKTNNGSIALYCFSFSFHLYDMILTWASACLHDCVKEITNLHYFVLKYSEIKNSLHRSWRWLANCRSNLIWDSCVLPSFQFMKLFDFTGVNEKSNSSIQAWPASYFHFHYKFQILKSQLSYRNERRLESMY